MRANCEDAERSLWLPERCMRPVDVPADTKDHADDTDSTNIGTGAMGIVVAIAVSAAAAIASGIAASQNVQTVNTVNKLADRVSSVLDLQNQINGHLHFGHLTVNPQMAWVQGQHRKGRKEVGDDVSGSLSRMCGGKDEPTKGVHRDMEILLFPKLWQ
ncbi:hypothetical protein STEG23_015063, partial [Scotinomys teguina]